MLQFFHIRPHDMKDYTLAELGRMREALDEGVTDGP